MDQGLGTGNYVLESNNENKRVPGNMDPHHTQPIWLLAFFVGDIYT